MAGTDVWDFVIVGAGTAGCVLANRLSADPGTRVLLLEAGGRSLDPWIRVPAGFYRNLVNQALIWPYETEPVPGLDGRRVSWPRGRVLGGSSAINGMIYTRGQKEDFDYWRQLGNVGWGFEDVLPYFRASEDQERGADRFHGVGGPISVSDARGHHELQDAFVAAAQEAGFPFNPDVNADTQDGVTRLQLTVRGRRRCSAADGYLRPALRRSNLRLEVRAMARRVLFEGRRAVGVEYDRDGTRHAAHAAKAVLLAGGSINSPQLLQLSGIGDASLLGGLGIPVVLDSPAVGRNLQDHFGVKLVFRTRRANTINELSRSPFRKLGAALSYVLARRGPLMMGAGSLGLFARSREGLSSPDLQMQFLPGSAPRPGREMHDFPGCTIACFPCRPESRGWLSITSADPDAHPAIQPNYLSTESDRMTLVRGMEIARRVFSAPSLAKLIEAEVSPGADEAEPDGLLRYAKRTGGTTYHPVSTCMMGTGPGAVVDDRLCLHGIGGLRVIDASIMPAVVSNNTNAATAMIAEKGAAMILQDLRG